MIRLKSIGSITNALALLIVFTVAFTACKSKKKLTTVSDPKEVSEQIEGEIEEDEGTEELDAAAETSTTMKLASYFDAIASAPSLASANASIQEAATMFSSPDVPVLIIFYSADGKEEFDEPTTIIKYLNYLKDQKKSPNRVEDYTTDSSGRIKELVLVRK